MGEPKPDAVYFQSRGFPEFRFMSNFHVAPIEIDGRTFSTVEHYYQAKKATNDQDFDYIATGFSPGEARRRGRAIKPHELWDSAKLGVMEKACRAKFAQHPDLGKMLLETGDLELVEYAPWGDTFWGVDKNYEGQNNLGKILMGIREELKGNRQ